MSALQKGDTVLITGATGWVGSHVAHEALKAGLKIKVVGRSEAKLEPLVKALHANHGNQAGHITTFIVEDFAKDGAFDEAIKGVQGVAYVALTSKLSTNADEVIPTILKGYQNILNAASSQQKENFKRLVFTSSSMALAYPNYTSEPKHLNTETWNEQALEELKTKPDISSVYSSSKVLAERLLWDHLKNNKPSFTITGINPNSIMGAPVPGYNTFSSSGRYVVDAAQGRPSLLAMFGAQYHVDVEDVAKLHVIALMNEDVKNERILAFSEKYNFNILLDTIKKVKPDAPVESHKEEWGQVDNTTVDVRRANELLKDQGGLRSLEHSIRGNVLSI